MSVLSKFMNRSFFERLISGILLVIIALVTIIAGDDVLLATVEIVSIIGLWELNKVFGVQKYVTGNMSYIYAIAYFTLLRLGYSQYIYISIVLFVIALLTVYVYGFPKVKTESVMAALFGVLYVVAMMSFVYIIRMGDNGLYNVWLVFLCSWGSDTCAYVFGVAFGKHKMAPVLSPKKSIEGAVGGVFGAALLGFIYALVFKDKFIGFNATIAYPIICAAGSFVAMTGDLAASAIKRNHNIKDYGKLIPGHGGIMDRFDSVIFVAPVIWVLLELMNAIF